MLDLVWVAQVVLRGEVEEESESTLIRRQCLLALASLISALEESTLGEPWIHGSCDP